LLIRLLSQSKRHSDNTYKMVKAPRNQKNLKGKMIPVLQVVFFRLMG